MKPAKPSLIAIIFALIAHWPGITAALSTDREQPIHIEADKLDIDESRQISIYQGNVEMQQGSLNINSDRVVFYFDENNEILRLEITGNPARLKQLNDKGDTVNGRALFMKYLQNESLLELHDEAFLQIAEDSIESDKIVVNIDTNAVQAGNGKDRVRMLIKPGEASPAQ